MVADEPNPAKNKRRVGGVIVPHPPRWYHRFAAFVLVGLVRTVAATIRVHWNDPSGFFDGPPAGPVLYCIWHNRLALCMKLYYGHGIKRNPTKGMAAIVSASRDGGGLAAILERFKVQPVRGSTSRRGPQALLELTTWSERGYDLAITPDGPRGPRQEVQEGVIALARVTGRPIVPISYRVNWKFTLGSWDRFQIPLPFARCEAYAAAPMRVPRESTDEEREALRLQLERTLNQLSGE
jgi:lysophospholipid acyltransferase (LPLAT)-like uncharacterized protein